MSLSPRNSTQSARYRGRSPPRTNITHANITIPNSFGTSIEISSSGCNVEPFLIGIVSHRTSHTTTTGPTAGNIHRRPHQMRPETRTTWVGAAPIGTPETTMLLHTRKAVADQPAPHVQVTVKSWAQYHLSRLCGRPHLNIVARHNTGREGGGAPPLMRARSAQETLPDVKHTTRVAGNRSTTGCLSVAHTCDSEAILTPAFAVLCLLPLKARSRGIQYQSPVPALVVGCPGPFVSASKNGGPSGPRSTSNRQ